MKTKIFALSLAIVLISIAFTGCGAGNTTESSTSTSSSSSATGVYVLPTGDNTYGSTTTTAASSSTTAKTSTSANASGVSAGTSTVSISPSTTFQSSGDTGDYTTGSYTVNTKTDPLSLRLAPIASDKTVTIRTIPKGTKITVIAVHEDWGYVVYEGSGGWVAMKYLKAAS